MATLTPNTFTNGMRLGPRLHRLRQEDSTVEDSFRIKNANAIFVFELRRSDISASPQTFADFDRNNTANAVRESFFQMYLRTCQNIVQAHFQSTVNAGEFPIEMFLEVVLRPEGEEVIDLVDREAKDARDLVADFIARYYGSERFNAAEIANQQGSLNGATTEAIRFMQGYDQRRVFSYRFYVITKESTCDFPSHMSEVLDMSIAHFRKFTGGEGVKSARLPNAKGNAQNGGGAGAGGRQSSASQLSSQGGFDAKHLSTSTAASYSRYVADIERWLLINDELVYINAAATYLRDENFLTERVKRQCADMTHGLKSGDNPASPYQVFSLNALFKSAIRKDLSIEPLQRDINEYVRLVGEDLLFTFPIKKLVLRIPIEKMKSASSIATMYMPEVQKRTIEPHMDMQRSVGGSIERVVSQMQSQSQRSDADDDVDDKMAHSIDLERPSPPVVRGSHTNSSDDEDDRAMNADGDNDGACSISGLEEDMSVTIDGENGAVFNGARPLASGRRRVDNDDDHVPLDGVSAVNASYSRAVERIEGPPAAPAVAAAHFEHPLIAQNAAIFDRLCKMYHTEPGREMAHKDVPEINAAFLMNDDFGDAKQMELAKTLTMGIEEGGPNRTDHHIMRARVYHNACQIIAAMEKEVPRTQARLRMQFAAMEEYRSKCCSSVSNISNPMKAMMLWLENVKRTDKAAYRCILKFVEPSLSLFAHSKFRLAQGLDEFECIFTAHTEIMMALASAKTAYYYVFDLRLNPLLYGPAGASKSEVLQKLVDLFIKGTVEAVTSESTHAGDTEDNENDVVRVMHELPATMASKSSTDSHVLDSLKNHMTAGILTRSVMDIDPITRARRALRITSEKQIAFCAATNMDECMLDKAVKDRFILIHQVKKLRPDCTIAQKMAQRANMSVEVQRQRADFVFNLQLDQLLYAHVEKLIMIGILTRPSIVCTPVILARYMDVLEQRFGIKCDRRLSYKVMTAARVHTIEAAITWLYQSPLSPCYGLEVDMWHLLVLEPWLKDTEEIAMYAIDDLRAQFFDPDQEQFFLCVRNWVLPDYLTQKLKSTLDLGFRRQQNFGCTTLETVNARHQAFRVWKKPAEKRNVFHGQRETRTTTEKLDVNKGEAQRQTTMLQESVQIAVQSLTGSNSAISPVAEMSNNGGVGGGGQAGALTPQQQAAAIGVKKFVSAYDTMSNDDYMEHATNVDGKPVVKMPSKASLLLGRFLNKNYDNSKAPTPEDIEEAQKAQYTYDYVMFAGKVADFARKVASANASNKAFREIDASELTQRLYSWTTRKVVSKRYMPNSHSSNPPVVLCEETDEETFDMIRIDSHNEAIYIHTSLLIGEISDPHEQALRECASLFTPKARFISALAHDPSTPHLLRVRDVGPRERANIVHSIQKMSREATLMGLSRETACAHGVEQDGVHANFAEDIVEDEEAMRAKPVLDFDSDRAPDVLARSLDDHATIEHFKAIGMPFTHVNKLFFNATLNDRVARETPGNVIQTPLNYPSDNLASLFTYKKNEEHFRNEFTSISLGDLRRKRANFGDNVKSDDVVKPVAGNANALSGDVLRRFESISEKAEIELIAGGLEDRAERMSKRKKTIDGNHSTTDTLMAPPPPMIPREKRDWSKRRPAAYRRAIEVDAVRNFMEQEVMDAAPPPTTVVKESYSSTMSVDGSEQDYIDRQMDDLVNRANDRLAPLAADTQSRMSEMLAAALHVSSQARQAPDPALALNYD